MVNAFKPYRAVLWSFFLLGLHAGQPPGLRGELLDTLCRGDLDSPRVTQSLIEEVEATGMPSATLNRLLIKGYHDRESVKSLSRLLCVIVRAEEDGLPPGLLFRKLDEGLGKRASLDRITRVVAAKAEDMRYVQALLSDGREPQLEDENVTRLTQTLSAGLTRDDLDDLFDLVYDVPAGMRVVAAEIKTDGRAIGFGESLLDQIISSGLAARTLTDDWSYFVNVAAEARKQGIADERITAMAVKALSRKESPEDLRVSLGLK